MELINPLPPNENLQQAIDHAHRSIQGIAQLTPDGFEGNEQAFFAAGISSQAFEHFRAIVLLTENRFANGSALALFRPFVEALLRAEWLLRCAAPEQFLGILQGTQVFLPFEQMALAVDLQTGLAGYFGQFTGAIFGGMSGYTHTGREQLQHRFDNAAQAVTPSYDDDRMAVLIEITDRYTLMHFTMLNIYRERWQTAADLAKLFS